jgi:hypothetical protein
VSRREEIRMSDGEVADFLDEQRTVICATIGRDGAPHVMPLWFVVRDDDIWAWTYASSQKVRNLERDPDFVAALGLAVYERYIDGDLSAPVRASIAKQAPKRVAIRFVEQNRASWDHRKLAAGP